MKYYLLWVFIATLTLNYSAAQEIAVLKYNGGGDWYANPTALPNLIRFCNTNLKTTIDEKPETVEAGSSSIFQFPFLHMTGHGNVVFFEPPHPARVEAAPPLARRAFCAGCEVSTGVRADVCVRRAGVRVK